MPPYKIIYKGKGAFQQYEFSFISIKSPFSLNLFYVLHVFQCSADFLDKILAVQNGNILQRSD